MASVAGPAPTPGAAPAAPTIAAAPTSGAATAPAAPPASDNTAADQTMGVASTISEAPASKPPSPYKDGTYTGWGTSRHGDIEATVVIADGRIASANISRCLTRYSCSWISALPGEVVARQSPEVDYVSGATQSTNAFYYAVVDALSKAK